MGKGLTLLELIVALAIGSIIVLIQVSFLSNSIMRYNRSILKDRQEVSSMEALRFIESEIQDLKNNTIIVKENQLILKKYGGDKNTIKILKKSNGQWKIVIEYYKVLSMKITTDTILEGNISFNAINDNNLIYITIYTLNGDKYERCFISNKVNQVTY